MDGIRQSFFYPGAPGANAMIGEGGVLSKQLQELFGKAGGEMRAGRVGGTHLDVLGRMLSGDAGFRVDMTRGGTAVATAKLGGRLVHIPTFDEMSHTVNLRGSKYAARMNVDYNPATKSYNLVTAEQSLTRSLEQLEPRMAGMSQDMRARMINQEISGLRNTQFIHVRADIHEAGGALPFFIGQEATIRAGNPIYEQAQKVNEAVKNSVMAAKMGSRAGYETVGGMRVGASHYWQRQSMLEHMTLSMMMLDARDETGKQLFHPGSVKNVMLSGDGVFDKTRYQEGASGRLVVGTLPVNSYGLLDVDAQLRKGISWARNAMATPISMVDALRLHDSHARAQQGLDFPKIRNSRIFTSTGEMAAERVAQAHAADMGMKGVVQLRTPMMVGVMVPKAGLSDRARAVAHQMIFESAADSGVIATSRTATETVASPWRGSHHKLATYGGEAGVYSQSQMHPRLAAEIQGAGIGGRVTFKNPISMGDLAPVHGMGAGWMGTQTTSTGVPKQLRGGKQLGTSVVGQVPFYEADELRLPFTEHITGAQINKDHVRFITEKIYQKGRIARGTPIELGGSKVGVHGVMSSAAPVDFFTSGIPGHGPNAGLLDNRLETWAHQIWAKDGEEGLNRFASESGLTTGRNAQGQLVISDFNAHNVEHMKRVRQTAMTFGLDLPPNVDMGSDEIKLLKGVSARTRQQYADLGKEASEGLLQYQPGVMMMGNRGGMPAVGRMGNVHVRVRDQRILASKISGMSGKSLQELRQSTTPAMEKYIDTLMSITSKNRHPVQKMMHLQEGIAAAGPEGIQPWLGPGGAPDGIKYRRMSASQYKAEFGKKIRRLSDGSRMADLEGTPWVRGGKTTNEAIVVDLDEAGWLAGRRKVGAGYRTKSVLIPTAESLGLRMDEKIRLGRRGSAVEGLRSSSGKLSTELHNWLVDRPDSPGVHYDAVGHDISSALNLTRAEESFGAGGIYHHAQITPKGSILGRLTYDAQLEPWQMSMSKTDARRFFRKQGMTKAEAKQYVTEVQLGKRQHFVHGKIEPMRWSGDTSVFEMKIAGDNRYVPSGGKLPIATETRQSAVAVNPYIQKAIDRDNDADQIYAYNTSNKRLTMAEEQDALRMIHAHDKKWLTAAAEQEKSRISGFGAQAPAGAGLQGSYEPLGNEYQSLISQATKMAEERSGKAVSLSARDVTYAHAMGMATQPEMATAAANLRYRQISEIGSSVALGGSGQFTAEHNLLMNTSVGADALAVVRKETEALEHVKYMFKYSENQALSKKASGNMSVAAEHFGGLVDPQLGMSILAAGDARGATEIARTNSLIADQLVRLNEASPARPLDVIARMRGANPVGMSAADLAGHAGPMSDVIGSLSRLSAIGVSSTWEDQMGGGATHIKKPWAEMLSGFRGEAPSAMAHGETVSGIARAGGMALDSARMAEEAAAAGSSVMKAAALEAAAGGKKAAQSLLKSKWGMAGAVGLGGLAAFGILRGMFRSSAPAYAPSGAPMPPNPIMAAVRDDRSLDYNDVPSESFARVQRVNQVRTHMQISGSSSDSSPSGFTGSADGAYASFGRTPNHRGQFIDDSGGLANRSKVQEMVRRRMMSDHG